ncbi:MAG: HAD-IA family hydrolase [Myxococcales bacterium]|nr:HAD-IA family hydrolase [Myxococcales bacterium]
MTATGPRTHDAWLVDLDGTLYHPLPVKLAMAAELALTGWGAVAVVRRFRKEHEAVRDEGARDPFRAQLERTAAALGRDLARVESVIDAWMHARPGKYVRWFRRRPLLAAIAAFRTAGGRTALVSDYPARKKLAALGAEALFDAVVAAGEPGGPERLKPDPDGYLRAAERLGVPAGRCLVLGDRDDADGAAARAAGMDFRRVG